ncbi:hypothetical protein WS57_16125 [Burkholderia pseudomultivorans]|nr:hypothetical protein WS57_16125 [Burkholderia pseudomultivorans]
MRHDEGAKMEVEYPHHATAGAPAAGASDIPNRAANLSRARDWHAAGRFDDAARRASPKSMCRHSWPAGRRCRDLRRAGDACAIRLDP